MTKTTEETNGDVQRNRYTIRLQHGDLEALAEELDAFWTFDPSAERAEVRVTADEGFLEAFEDETELSGVSIEEVAEYEE